MKIFPFIFRTELLLFRLPGQCNLNHGKDIQIRPKKKSCRCQKLNEYPFIKYENKQWISQLHEMKLKTIFF